MILHWPLFLLLARQWSLRAAIFGLVEAAATAAAVVVSLTDHPFVPLSHCAESHCKLPDVIGSNNNSYYFNYVTWSTTNRWLSQRITLGRLISLLELKSLRRYGRVDGADKQRNDEQKSQKEITVQWPDV